MSEEQTVPQEEFVSWKVLYYDIQHNLLFSPQQKADWRPREPFQAHCDYAHDLRNMAFEKCSCGIYSRKEIDKDLLKYDGHTDDKFAVPTTYGVLAQLTNWGWVLEAHSGFRAAKAYPKSIVVKSTMPQDVQEKIRNTYQVPVVSNDEAWGVVEGTIPKVSQATKDAIANMSQAQLQKAMLAARRQEQYRRWYYRCKRLRIQIQQETALLNRLPTDLRRHKSQLAQLEKEGPYGNGG